MDIKERIRELLRKDGFIKDPFGKLHKKEKSIKTQLETGRPIIPEKRSIRIPGLRSFKRFISAFLFVNFVFLIIGMGYRYIPGPANDYILWIFILGAWISLDYLWKTRKEKTEAFE